jgi:hypothetical protein
MFSILLINHLLPDKLLPSKNIFLIIFIINLIKISSKGEKVEVLWNAMAYEDLALLVE